VIVVDANILIYAYDTASPVHEKSRDWLEDAFSGAEPVGLPWQSITAFLRVMTNPKLHGRQFTLKAATEIVEAWMAQSSVRILVPTDDHWIQFRRMILEGSASGPLASDAELAGLTLEYGGVLYTADRDFARFPGLRWVNPLVA
jgi:toxin-antitoxin system PIN domain toxin